ncbi:DUF5684 domain-containing protein [Microbacterium sp. NPDC057407]|uniref:DUF5684 domain-containing protein n=1 Tax=Microbacterium sp. NPDC057407 TaxID=3346120 RepID=UPI00366DF987
MTAFDVATTTGAAAPVVPVLISLFAALALYVWTAIALSAVFRKSGEEAWRAWVPILNLVVLLQLGGFSGWLVLVALVPGFGWLALWIVQVVACYRINVAFGHGAGMTVLAALLFPVWATVLGFGPDRWVGTDTAVVGVRRSPTGEDDALLPAFGPALAGPPPLPSPPAAPSVAGWSQTATGAAGPPPLPSTPPLPAAPAPAAPAATETPAPAATAAHGFTPEPPPAAPATRRGERESSPPPGTRRGESPAPTPPGVRRGDQASEPEPAALRGDPADPISSVPRSSAAVPSDPFAPSVLDDATAAPAFRADADSAASDPAPPAPAPAASARANQGWGGFELGAVVELTSEVTAAVSGAPRPVAAVPSAGPAPAPAVTRVPSARRSTPAEPWAPARSPLPEPDAFPEASGEVSAVVGAPDAGIPRSARSSVSAQHVLPDAPDDVEATIIASRRRAHWSLVLPTGTPVALLADVVLVGRRPSPSTAYPNAQLVEVHDGTVSKTHLRLERHGDEWSVTDLQSTNGTILIASDGSEREIVPGAAHRAPGRLLIGDAEVRLTADDAGR